MWTWRTSLKFPESRPSSLRRSWGGLGLDEGDLSWSCTRCPPTDSAQVPRVQVQVHRGDSRGGLGLGRGGLWQTRWGTWWTLTQTQRSLNMFNKTPESFATHFIMLDCFVLSKKIFPISIKSLWSGCLLQTALKKENSQSCDDAVKNRHRHHNPQIPHNNHHHGRAGTFRGVLNVLIRAFGPQLGLDIVAYGWVQFWMIHFRRAHCRVYLYPTLGIGQSM